MNTSNTCQEKNKLVPTHIPHFNSHTASVASRDTKTANLGKLVCLPWSSSLSLWAPPSVRLKPGHATSLSTPRSLLSLHAPTLGGPPGLPHLTEPPPSVEQPPNGFPAPRPPAPLAAAQGCLRPPRASREGDCPALSSGSASLSLGLLVPFSRECSCNTRLQLDAQTCRRVPLLMS